MIGLDADFNNHIIGKPFPKDRYLTNYSDYYGHGGQGDKKFVFRTDVIRQYPSYPEFEGENYVGIACKFALIDQDYQMLAINDVLCNVEYQPDGSTNTMFQQYLKNPNGFIYNRKIMMTYPVSIRRLVAETVHYISSSIQIRNGNYIKESPRKILTTLLTPAGFLLYLYIRKKANAVRIGV